jgi:hypothetical protein
MQTPSNRPESPLLEGLEGNCYYPPTAINASMETIKGDLIYTRQARAGGADQSLLANISCFRPAAVYGGTS